MANQISINIGAAANDGTGDPLRTAFNDVNLNFANVWATGLPNSNIQFNNNRITTVNTNANLILAPNGTGKVAANVDIVPNTANAFSLGSATRRWNQIYTQYIDASASLNLTGDLTVGGNLTVTGNIIEMGNIVTDAKTLQLANTASNTTAANGSGITVGANDNIATLLYNSTSNIWTTNIGFSAVGNVSAPYFVGNGSQLTGITTYANANAVAYGQAGWAGNIIPSANAVYSLGNATNQWKSLYVSNTTIYINNVPIGLSAGNVLTVNGDDVVTTNANGQTTLGNLAVDDNNIYNTNGQGVVISNFSFIAETETAYVQIPAGNSASDLSVVQKQGNVRLAANAAAWTFATNGNLNLPGNTSQINYANGTSVLANYATISSTYSSNATTQSINNPDGGGTYNNSGTLDIVYTAYTGASTLNFDIAYQAPLTANIGISVGAVSTPLIQSNANIQIQANTGTAQTWTFGADGTLTTPGNITVANVVTANTFVSNAFNVVTAGNLSITSQYGLGFTGTILEDNGTLELIANGGGGVVAGWDSTYGNGLGNIATVNFNEVGGEGILLRTGNRAATEYNWNFDNTGVLTLPGEGVLRSVGDSVTLQSYNVGTGNVQSVYLGSGGGLGFFDQDIGGNWLEIFKSGAEPQIRVPVGRGNLNVQTAQGINAYDWVFDNTGNFTAPGNITGNTAGFAIGYRDIPQVTFSANATAALTDAGKHFYSTTAGNLEVTLPDNANVAFPTGATITVVVNAAGNVIVAQGAGVSLYMAGSATTGNRTVGAYGLASVMKVAANTWVISGTGVY